MKYNPDDIYNIHTYGIDSKSNNLFLFGESDYIVGVGSEDSMEPGVEYVMTNRFIKNLHILSSISDEPIVIHMKTCGGIWEEGMAIYDAISQCKNHVTIINYTHARSMSSIILQAADKRIMMPNSIFMFHGGTFSMEGTVKQAVTEIELLQESQRQMIDIYVESARNSEKFKDKKDSYIKKCLKNHMDRKEDVYLSPSQAIEWGFADEIFDGDWEDFS